MLNFVKMTGLGNDYIYVDCTDGTKLKDIFELVRMD